MKKKYQVKEGKRINYCTYKNCRQLENTFYEGIHGCDRHAGILYRLTPVSMESTWFSRFVQGAAEFIAWLFRGGL